MSLIPEAQVQTDMDHGMVMTKVQDRIEALVVDDPVTFPAGELGDHPEHALSEQLGAWTQMAGWMEFEVARAENRKDVAEAQFDRLQAQAYTAAEGVPTVRKNEATADPKVGEAHVVLLIEKAILRIVRAQLSRYEKNYFAISREMTRRQKSMEREARSDKVGDVPGQPNPVKF